MSDLAPAPRGVPVFRRIVVGVDGREAGSDALALAVLLAQTCGGDLAAADASSARALHEMASATMRI